MGGIAYFLIKIMKIRSRATALLGIIIGCLIFNVFKWALYVQWDNETLYEAYYEETLEDYEDESAFEYFEFVYDFSDDGVNIISSEEIEERVEAMQEMTAEEYIEYMYDGYGGVSQYLVDIKVNGYDYTREDLQETSSFDFFYEGFVDENNIVESIEKAYEMDVEEYYNEVITSNIHDVTYLITHPKEFFENIKDINEYGRWSISSSRSSYSSSYSSSYTYGTTSTTTKNDNVKGVLLWIVWIGELFAICIPAVMTAYKRADRPFIESEKKWAILNDSDAFMFKAPVLASAAGKAFKENPDSLFANEHLDVRPGNAGFLKVQLYHSSTYDENYASLVLRSYNPKNRNYNNSVVAKYVCVDQGFVYRLFKTCNMPVPFAYNDYSQNSNTGIPSVNTASTSNIGYAQPMAQQMDSVSYTPTSTPQISDLQAEEKSQEDVMKEFNS